MFELDFVPIPTPSDYVWNIMDVGQYIRTADVTMHAQRKGTKRKLELKYKYLPADVASSLLIKVSQVSFSFTYPDGETGAMRTGSFYCGDRSATAIDYQNGVMRWKDVKFNLIEL